MELIEIGQIVNTHGIKGEVKLNPWTDDLYDIEELDVLYYENGDELKLERARVHKNTVIIKIKGIDNINNIIDELEREAIPFSIVTKEKLCK